MKASNQRWKRFLALLLTAALLLLAAAGCGAAKQESQAAPESEAAAAQQEAQSPVDTSGVADASQMTTVEEVVEEGMVPVPPSEIADGVYSVKVDCSSSMFKITDCELTVADGAMTALLTMSGSSYLYVYPGTAAEAAAADPADFIAAGESAAGTNTFLLPVEALDAGIPCAAFSKNKELWYDRTLLFRADSLPLEAFQSGLVTAESLGLADGSYLVDVALTGGSGRASVQSPATLSVKDGHAVAEIVWSSPNYDAMQANGSSYAPVNTEGDSTFLLDVPAFDRPLAVQAETTAMSQPHWIVYTLRFDSASLERAAS